MVNGWRRAFCTSIPKENTSNNITNNTSNNVNNSRSPKLGFSSKFNFFSSSTSSSPSTPRSQTPLSSSTTTPILRCKTAIDETSPKLIKCTTTPVTPPCSSSPHSSPSTFSLLKNTLRFSKLNRCGVCLHSVKTGQGTAIFTAECSHSFHFPCITSLAVKNNGVLLCCPLCGSKWNDAPFLPIPSKKPLKKSSSSSTETRLYDDDEPLVTQISSIQFNTILESEEENLESDDEFPGFFTPRTPQISDASTTKGVKVTVSPESAVIAVGRSYETYAVLLTVKAPSFPARSRRTSVDIVVVIDIGSEMSVGKLQSLKKAMRGMISSLSSNDRLSVVAFASTSKRLLALRRMTPSGKRSARRLIDAVNLAGEGCCLNDALRKAAKVVQDRKDKNHFASIVLMDGHDEERENQNHNKNQSFVSSTRFSEIPVHTFRVREDFSEEVFVKCVNVLLSVVVLDVRVQFGIGAGSAGEIAAVYSCTGRPGLLSSGSAKLGDLYSCEEREILVELKVPASSIGLQHVLSVRSYHKDPSFSKQVIYGGEQSLVVPRPRTIRSSDPKIQRLRSLFVMTRAVAESRRLLAERNDFSGAERLLGSAQVVLGQSNLKTDAAEEYKKRVEAELAEVKWRRQAQPEEKRKKEGSGGGGGGGCCVVDEKGEPLTPTSAWKAAERLAKVAMMRKNLNRVSDLHGFEDARF